MTSDSVDLATFKTEKHARRRAWLAEDPSNPTLCEWLLRCNGYCPAKSEATGVIAQHPSIDTVLRSKQGDFFRSLSEALTTYGGLTSAQTVAAHGMMGRSIGFSLDDDERALEEVTGFYGAIGERVHLQLYLERLVPYKTGKGYEGFMHLFDTYEGHRVVYSGSTNKWPEGSCVSMYATIVAHKRYRGEAQTMVARPKVTEVVSA